MKPNLDFDPDFASSSGCHRVRQPLIRRRVLVLVSSGLIACGLIPTYRVGMHAEQKRWAGNPNRMLTRPQVRTAPPQVRALPLDDQFVIAADTAIDPNMVHAAPAQMDEAMVINERGNGRLP